MITKINTPTRNIYSNNLNFRIRSREKDHQSMASLKHSQGTLFYSYKPINFSGNINPISNYHSASDALNIPLYKQINSQYNLSLPTEDFARKAIDQIFANDSKFLNIHYFSDFNSYDKFSKLGFVDGSIDFNDNIKSFLENTNQRKLATDYTCFFDNNLKSLEKVAKGEYHYTNLFLDKKIGNKNLVDFWLETLGQYDVPVNEKINTLNRCLAETYNSQGNIDNITVKTIEEYFTNVLNQNNPQINDKLKVNIELENLLNLKDRLNNVLRDGVVEKSEFENLINDNKLMSLDINGKPIKLILLLQLNNPAIEDVSNVIQDEFLDEISNDENLRNDIVKKTLSLIRRNIIDLKTDNEKQLYSINYAQDKELINFDKKLISELFIANPNAKAKQIVENIKRFEIEANKLFKQMMIINPFTSKEKNTKINEKTNIVFTLVNDSFISEKDAEFVSNGLEKLADLVIALNSKNKTQSNELWNSEILNIAMKQWNNTHLPQLIKETQQNYLILETFLKKDKTDDLIQTGIIDTFFNSEIVTPEQKAFLANKEESSEFISLCNFLVKHVPNNQRRKEIIDKLIENERVTINSFETFKKYFIEDVRNANINGSIYNKIIQGNKISDLIVSVLSNGKCFDNSQENIEFLKGITDEELSMAFDTIKDKYIEQQFNLSVRNISDIYDISKQTEKILNNLQININGKTYNLFDMIDKDFSYLESVLEKNKCEQQKQLNETIKLLTIDTELSTRVYQTLNVLLDKMIAANPYNVNSIVNARSNFDKFFEAIKQSTPAIGYATVSAIIYQNPLAFLPVAITTLLNINNQFQT